MAAIFPVVQINLVFSRGTCLIFTLKQFIISHSNLDPASSAGVTFCNSYTDRDESENEKRRKKEEESLSSLPILPLFL